MANLSPSKQKERGRIIGQAFRYIQQIFKETSALMKYLDKLMGRDWVPTYRNKITKEVTASLLDPDYWLVEAVFRIYHKEKEPSLKKGITIDYWNDRNLIEPVIIAGKMEYYRKDENPKNVDDHDHWDLYYSWFDDIREEDPYDGETIYSTNYEKSVRNYIKRGEFFGLPLMWVQTEKDIEQKIYDKLIKL